MPDPLPESMTFKPAASLESFFQLDISSQAVAATHLSWTHQFQLATYFGTCFLLHE